MGCVQSTGVDDEAKARKSPRRWPFLPASSALVRTLRGRRARADLLSSCSY